MTNRQDAEKSSYKMYVTVGAEFSDEGQMRPRYLITTDGRKWEISQTRKIQRMAARKAGGCGVCYTVLINNHEANLFYEDADVPRWFVESKHPIVVSD